MAVEGARLLVIDDEAAIRDLLHIGLSRAGFQVRGVADGKKIVSVSREYSPDLIILDVMLPGENGFTLLPILREVTEAPIIMLSAKNTTEERIMGLTRGADDYLGKPFELGELIARINSALRRPRLDPIDTLRFSDLVVNIQRKSVFRGGKKIELSSTEFDLLLTFMQQPDKTLSRSQLLDQVWGYDSDVFPNTVETYISYLRAKIDNGEETKLIHTLRGRGYTLSLNMS